jgi:uncharacterized phiE125 gp8 family phage protein
MLGAQALVTVADAKGILKKTDDNDLTTLELLIGAVSDHFNGETGRALMTASYTAEKFDGTGWADFWLPNYPVTTLTSVHENDILLVLDTDYYAYLADGRLRRTAAGWPGEFGLWSSSPKAIKVTYVAGYTPSSIPGDLKLAALIQIAQEWEKFLHKSWGQTNRSIAGQSVTIESKDDFVERILEKYKRRTA